jgi:hypothetical protein
VPNEGAALRALLETLDPKARNDLRRVLIRDQADRDAIASRLMRYGDLNGQGWADVIDFLMMHPQARRQVVRLSEKSMPQKPDSGMTDSLRFASPNDG